MGTSTRRSEIEILRAISIIAVVLYHADTAFHGGFVGVDVFFVLSGFVISRQLLSELRITGTLNLIRFYIRRFKRLYPALLSMVLFVLAISLFVVDPIKGQSRVALNAVFALFGVSNIWLAKNTGSYFDTLETLNPLLHTWSLSVEEQIYMVLPLILTLASRGILLRNRSLTFFLLISLCLLSFMTAIIEFREYFPALFGFYSPIVRFWQFGCGMLIAILEGRCSKIRESNRFILGNLGVMLVICSLLFLDSSINWPSIATLLPTMGTSMIIMASTDKLPILLVPLNNKPIHYVGRISYSLYIWHWPVITFGKLLKPHDPHIGLICAVLSIAPAILSYNFVEKPFRYSKWKVKKRIVIASLLILSMGTSTSIIQNGGYPRTVSRIFSDLNTTLNSMEDPCFVGTVLQAKETLVENCSVENNTDEPTKSIFLIGDSTAQQFNSVIKEISNENRWEFGSFTGANCVPFPDIRMSKNRDLLAYSHCQLYSNKVTDWMLKLRPQIIILSIADEYWWNEQIEVEFAKYSFTSRQAEKIFHLKSNMLKWIEKMRSRGHQILLIRPLPNFSDGEEEWSPYLCNYVSFRINRCESNFLSSELEVRHKKFQELILDLNEAGYIQVLDYWSRFCNQFLCSPIQKQKSLYLDSKHLTLQATFLLKEEISNDIKIKSN